MRDSWEQRLLNYVHTPYAHLPYCDLCNPKILHKFLREIEDLMLIKKKMAGDGQGKRAVLKVVHPVLCRLQRRLL